MNKDALAYATKKTFIVLIAGLCGFVVGSMIGGEDAAQNYCLLSALVTTCYIIASIVYP